MFLFTRLLLAALFLYSTSAYSAEKIDVSIGYLELIVPAPAVLSNLDPVPDDEGVAGAKLALSDNATTGKFLGQNYSLETRRVDDPVELLAAAKELLKTTPFLVLKMPSEQLLAVADLPEASNAILFNASSPDNELRGARCRANLFHTLPSRSMLTDALAQFSVWKKWGEWAIIAGAQADDKAFAEALKTSAKKFRITVSAQKDWSFDADMRRNAGRELPLFTQDLPDHDLLLIADEADDYARYIAYNTWLPRPVAGSSGLVPVAWSRVVEQHGAAQLQSRFQKSAARTMRSVDYAAWAAIRSIGEAVTRTKSRIAADLKTYMLGEKFELAGFKGRKLTFRGWNGQLRQPIPLVTPHAVVALAPLEGFLHQRNELDTLGFDQAESGCTAFGE